MDDRQISLTETWLVLNSLNELWTGPGFLWREMPGIRERASSKEKKNVVPKQGNASKKQRRIIVQSIKIKGIRSNDSEIYVPEWNKTMYPCKIEFVSYFFNANWNRSRCRSRWENLDRGQYRFQPIKFVISLVPGHIIGQIFIPGHHLFQEVNTFPREKRSINSNVLDGCFSCQ